MMSFWRREERKRLRRQTDERGWAEGARNVERVETGERTLESREQERARERERFKTVDVLFGAYPHLLRYICTYILRIARDG
jgi:hypothetical protein